MQQKQCLSCQKPVDLITLYEANKQLFDDIDSGKLEEITDHEEGVYHGVYCAECSQHILQTEKV